jgi:putative hemolysin
MTEFRILVELLVCLALSLVTSLNLALRVVTRARLAPFFERYPARSFERFIALRGHYLHSTAILRTLLILVVVVGVFERFDLARISYMDPHTLSACAALLAVLLVFSVAVPNALAKYCGDGLIVHLLPLLDIPRYLFFPLSVVLDVFDPVVRRLAGVPVQEAGSYADQLEQEILHVVSEGELHGAVDEEEKEMIESVIELADTRVNTIMTPRTQIVAVPVGTTREELIETILDRGHSRIPVYEQTIDTILGVVYAKDLLRISSDRPDDLSAILRKPLFIPESKQLRELLREFQHQKIHIAIVLDEYGGTAGLVTIEDILEELVGEITDEFDFSSPQQIRRIDDSTVEVDARIKVQDLNTELGVNLPEDGDFETVGGFVFSLLGKIPVVGEQCEHENISLQVIGAEPRRITRLRLHIRPTETAGADI